MSAQAVAALRVVVNSTALHSPSHLNGKGAWPGETRPLDEAFLGYDTLEHMKLLILYRQNSEHARAVETFMHDYKSHFDPNAPITSYDLDSIEGAETAKLYDVVQYPAFIVTTEDGMVTNMWQGEQLPLMSEVQSYLEQ